MTMSGRGSPPTLTFSALDESTAQASCDTLISRRVTSPGPPGPLACGELPPQATIPKAPMGITNSEHKGRAKCRKDITILDLMEGTRRDSKDAEETHGWETAVSLAGP